VQEARREELDGLAVSSPSKDRKDIDRVLQGDTASELWRTASRWKMQL
jgi:hypothetical protein